MLLWLPILLLIATIQGKLGYFLLLFPPSHVIVKLLQNYIIGILRSDGVTKNLSELFDFDENDSIKSPLRKKKKKKRSADEEDYSKLTETIAFGSNKWFN